MKYIAVKTRGATKDYAWQFTTETACDIHALLESLTDEKFSLAVISNELGYSLYAGGIATSEADGKQRVIRMSVAFCGLSEHEARSLVVYIIRYSDRLGLALCNAVDWDTSMPEYGWTVDFNKIGQIVLDACRDSSVLQTAPAFKDAWSRFYTPYYPADDEEEQLKLDLAKSSASLVLLASELESFSFTSSYGIKLLISRNPSDMGYNRATVEADRMLCSDANDRNLFSDRIKKKQQIEPSQSYRSREPSKMHSVGNSPSPFCPSSKSVCWISSKRGLLTVCAAMLLTVIIVQTFKKKEPKLPVMKSELQESAIKQNTSNQTSPDASGTYGTKPAPIENKADSVNGIQP